VLLPKLLFIVLYIYILKTLNLPVHSLLKLTVLVLVSLKPESLELLKKLKKSGFKISDGLNVTSTMASSLSMVPSLSSIAGPAAWALGKLATLAAAFGYSKPNRTDHIQTFAPMVAKYNANSDGDVNAFNLAMKHDNRVNITDDLSIRNEDEMSLAFLKSIECYGTSFVWSVGESTDVNLFSQPVHPAMFFENVNLTLSSHTLTGQALHPVAYLAHRFSSYRGGIRLKFKFIKTQFHTGRLQFTFTPLSTPAAITPTLATSTYSMRHILDLSTGDELVFDCPYLLAPRYIPAFVNDLGTGEYLGQVDVVILNPLRGPETVSPSISVMVFISFCDDFELQIPTIKPDFFVPVTFATGTTDPSFKQDFEVIPEADNGGTSIVTVDEPIGGISSDSMGLRHSSLCVGEHFSSIRQLLSRFNVFWVNGDLGNTTGNSIWPWAICSIGLVASGSTSLTSFYGNDTFSWIMPMYAFMRGGMRIAYANKVQNANSILSNTADADQLYSGVQPHTIDQPNSSALMVTFRAVTAGNNVTFPSGPVGVTIVDSPTGVVVAEAPYYCRTKLTGICPSTFWSGRIPWGIDQPLSRVNSISNSAFTGTTFHRAIGEDFQALYFINSPLRYVSYA